MPSPFPGMDPYLEGSLWGGVHSGLSVEIATQLRPKIRPRYVARTNERFVVTTAGMADDGITVTTTVILPDTFVTERHLALPPTSVANPPSAGTAVATPPLQVATVMPETVRLISVEVRDASDQRLVTAIEVLSPTNKRGGGRREYLRRRRKILPSSAHLLEIDLLRTGHRPPMRDPLPDAPYFVFLSRADRRPMTDVWPIHLDQSLPMVPVPLLPGDADVFLDLQAVFAVVYENFDYELTLDYSRPPEIPLSPDQAVWTKERLGIPRVR